MARTRFVTLMDMLDARLQVRVWCFRCFRWHDVALRTLGDRGLTPDTRFDALRFRCRRCRRSDEVLVLPMRERGDIGVGVPRGEDANTALVSRFFHTMRRASKGRTTR
jgi:hypothetical protein